MPNAGRLTEDPCVSVLLLEAGPDFTGAKAPDGMLSANPARIIHNPTYHFPDLKATRTSTQERALLWRGRGTGGCSNINGQLALRGLPEDFDWWDAQLGGGSGWAWKDMAAFHSKLENDADFGQEGHHGSEGPTPLVRIPEKLWGHVDCALRDAARNAGHPSTADSNSEDPHGISGYAMNATATVTTATTITGTTTGTATHTTRRATAADCYIDPVRHRPNLHIRGDTLVARVLFSSQDGKVQARGVETSSGSVLKASREVLLCCGAVHSPCVLQRSGVGPRDVLDGLNIPVVADLPVGIGLQVGVSLLLLSNIEPFECCYASLVAVVCL